jgi:hypothetical protein
MAFAATALLLLLPQTPMLFQGQEFSSSMPFLYFADHNPDLAKLVRSGRAQFLSQFASLSSAEAPKGKSSVCSRTVINKGEPLEKNVGDPRGGPSPYPWAIPVLAKNVAAEIELRGHFDPLFPDFEVAYPDQLRADEFLNEFDQFVAARKAGKSRKDAIYAAYDRFYKGDIAHELVRGVREDGGLFTLEDLANWKVRIEEPLKTSYKGIDVYKLPQWQQGPAMLQALNILENTDVKGMGYNSPKYIHAVYQTLSLSFADRDFYYGDPYFAPEEPMKGLLSKEYAKQRFAQIDWTKNDPNIKPGDPYPFQGGTNPFTALLAAW